MPVPNRSLRLVDAGKTRGIDAHKVHVTFFQDEYAETLTTKDVTLAELGDLILNAKAKTKTTLPWLKGATFGDTPNKNHCLRYDDNVTSFSMVHLDYDGKEIAFEDGVAKAKSAGFCGLFYTSPSHTVDKPKWRVLLPTSTDLPPDKHHDLSHAAAAKLGVLFGAESFTLSQSYYYGTADKIKIKGDDGCDVLIDGTAVRIEIVDGGFVDLAGLPPWTGASKPIRRDRRKPKNTPPADRAEVELALSTITKDDYWTWLYVGAALWDEFGDDGFELFDQWSRKSDKYDPHEVSEKWQKCQAFTDYSIGTVFRYADEASPGWRFLARLGDGDGRDGFDGPLTGIVSCHVKVQGARLDQDALKQKLRAEIEAAPKHATRRHGDIEKFASDLYLDNLIDTAIQKSAATAGIKLDDFIAHLESHQYIFIPTRKLWPGASVNACVPPVPSLKGNGAAIVDGKGKPKFVPATSWIDKNRAVVQLTWMPGQDMEIHDKVMDEGGLVDHNGVAIFNTYRPPTIAPGDPADIAPWRDHIHRIYPHNVDQILDRCAHLVQFPQIKINHATVLGGEQGIGKDSLLEPVRRGVGAWNCQEVSPSVIMTSTFNGYLKAVMLRISEGRDLGESDRYRFYDHTKTIMAAPPDVHRINEKYLGEKYILNCCGVFITTNYKSNGLYLPADDRRHYVCWSDLVKEDFDEDYWRRLWKWYDAGGAQNVVSFLAARDLSRFDPKAPPPKTEAFWEVVNANRSTEENEIADVIDMLGNPDAVTLAQITAVAANEPDAVTQRQMDAAHAAHPGAPPWGYRIQGLSQLYDWLSNRHNIRIIPVKMAACGYAPVRNRDRADGLWLIQGRRQVIYARKAADNRHRACQALVARMEAPNR